MNADAAAGQELTRAAKRGAKGQLWRRIRKNWAAYFFISPFFILYSIFGLFGILLLALHQLCTTGMASRQ